PRADRGHQRRAQPGRRRNRPPRLDQPRRPGRRRSSHGGRRSGRPRRADRGAWQHVGLDARRAGRFRPRPRVHLVVHRPIGRALPRRAMTAEAVAGSSARPRVVERYRRFLPITDATPALTLGEGFTPLVAAPRLGGRIGVPNLHLKLEGLNPTGSFKDRGMVVAVSKALEAGATSIICASTGNTSASAAAYGAAAGLEVAVVLPKGAIATGKLLQALIAGAKVIAIEGSFDDALRVVRSMTANAGSRATLVNSVNPHRIAGQKTAAMEICDDLGRAPDFLAIPVGNAGNITAYWAGFTDYAMSGVVETRPRMLGFQAAGAAPIV